MGQSMSPTPMSWLATQAMLHALADERVRDGIRKSPNPRPPGRPVDGSATDDVMRWLIDRPSRQAWWSMHQIIRGTGRTGKACCWAVIYLHRIGAVERERATHNSRYLRYRVSAMVLQEMLQAGA